MSNEDEKKRVTIKILGEEYAVRSPSSRQHMYEVGAYVDAVMREIYEKYPRMSRQKIAILTALNLASEILFLKKEKSTEEKGENEKE